MSAPIAVVLSQERRLRVAVGAGMTNRGSVRDRNEDSPPTDPSGALWAIADGMDGYGYGDLVSEIVTDGLAQIPEDTADPSPALIARLKQANDLIRQRRQSAGLERIGSAVVVVLISEALAHLAEARDFRAHLLRGGPLRPLTRDHPVVQEMIDHSELAPEAAEGHPESHMVTRAVGREDELEVDRISVPVAFGDRLLLCSDGLTRVREALECGAPDIGLAITVQIGEG